VSEWNRGERLAALAATLPDVPRWLETRSMLLQGDAEVFGLTDGEPPFIVRDPTTGLISIVGRPGAGAFREALYRNEDHGEALAQFGDEEYAAAHLPGWRMEPATLHILANESRLTEVPDGMVRGVSAAEIREIEEMDPELRKELLDAVTWTEVAAALADGRPVSFCYSASETETLWDIAIDTLEPYRREGYAATVVSYMVQRMAKRRKRPVWGAEESNVASMALAVKLGFVPAERLVVFHAPGE
jgi:RimJ/RimL family protein N-acetyltransferase